MANVGLDGGGQNLDVERGIATFAAAGTRVEIPTNLSRLYGANIQNMTSGTSVALLSFVINETITSTSTGTSIGAACGTSIMVDAVSSPGTSGFGTSANAQTLYYEFHGKS